MGNAIGVDALTGNLKSLQQAVEQDPNVVHMVDTDGWCLLYGAALGGKPHIINYLLDRGADVNYVGRRGHTVLSGACQYNHVEAIELLIQRGADISVPGNGNSMLVALYFAAMTGQGETLDVLEKYGVSVADMPRALLQKTWDDVWSKGDHVTQKRLLDAGANPYASTEGGPMAFVHMIMPTSNSNSLGLLQEWDRIYSLLKARCLHESDATVSECRVPFLQQRVKRDDALPIVEVTNIDQTRALGSQDVEVHDGARDATITTAAVVLEHTLTRLPRDVYTAFAELLSVSNGT